MIFTVFYVSLIYPWVGLLEMGWRVVGRDGILRFRRLYAGTQRRRLGALIGAIMLGARRGKYVGDRIRALPGHNMPLATIGVFLLWLGWFGFNGGSVLSADPGATSLTLMTTCIAAAAGGLGAMYTSWIFSRKPDLSMGLNGILAGLVGITAGADQMGLHSALFIGVIAGVIVYFSVVFFDRIRVDDPVGRHIRSSRLRHLGHPGCGHLRRQGPVPGSLSPSLLASSHTASSASWLHWYFFGVIKAVMGLRVSEEEEVEGLDQGEHGMPAYSDFVSATSSR